MKFRLLRGTFVHHGKTIRANGRTPSAPFDYPKDLCKIFPNKFQQLDDAGNPALAPMPTAPIARRKVLVKTPIVETAPATVAATTASPKVQAEARKRVVLPTPPAPPPAPPAPANVKRSPMVAVDAIGVDVTAKYPTATRIGAKVYRKGIHYSVIGPNGNALITGANQKALVDFFSKET